METMAVGFCDYQSPHSLANAINETIGNKVSDHCIATKVIGISMIQDKHELGDFVYDAVVIFEAVDAND